MEFQGFPSPVHAGDEAKRTGKADEAENHTPPSLCARGEDFLQVRLAGSGTPSPAADHRESGRAPEKDGPALFEILSKTLRNRSKHLPGLFAPILLELSLTTRVVPPQHWRFSWPWQKSRTKKRSNPSITIGWPPTISLSACSTCATILSSKPPSLPTISSPAFSATGGRIPDRTSSGRMPIASSKGTTSPPSTSADPDTAPPPPWPTATSREPIPSSTPTGARTGRG